MAAAITSTAGGGLTPKNVEIDLTSSFAPSTSTLPIAHQYQLSAASTPTSTSSPVTLAALSPSAASPLPIQPATTARLPPPIKPSAVAPGMASLDSPSATGPVSMTSKEWTLPPRPKPGRKPATDTPPTKRKAQNRAAQRAFRERRAARVGELEEQLEEQKEEHERTVREMRDRITYLEAESRTLQLRCQGLEALLEKERLSRSNLSGDGGAKPVPEQTQIEGMRSSRHVPIAPKLARSNNVSAPGPRPLTQALPISQMITPPDTANTSLDLTCGNCTANGPCACAEQVFQPAEIPIWCGGCTEGSRCACLEETVKASIAADLKRPRSPGSLLITAAPEKRQRTDPELEMETNFTTFFSPPENAASPTATPAPLTEPHTLTSIEPEDACGFCSDGTYCVCAETMVPASTAPPPLPTPNHQITQQTHTPPPSENDVVPIPMEVTATGAIKLPGLQSLQRTRTEKPGASQRAAGSCGPNGPGTCAQCLSDPKSGLFCRSLAANFERNNRGQQQSGGCCGNAGPGGCCKAGSSTADAGGGGQPNNGSPSSNSGLGLSLSCADAYKTLASHRHFDEAADDIGSWLPKLRAVPVPPENMKGAGGLFHGHAHVAAGRAPIEVEAASIMSVLKDFDVRFGRG
ncbi:AP-1-like transcription factor [Echria macrotheca]|uniref:AP-1-like transcription factor n=1 Tax=Echria macrotheca TaxID=438768 RepID=A0AAJ0BL60_9PEZI|nr:AP-1-like transcription factor [Echria macrotheca]